MKRTKCSAIIKNIIGPYFQKKLIRDIGESSYSLLIDESTDISVQKYLGISIIYFSEVNSKIVTTSLGLVELNACDANGIANAVLKTIAKYGLQKSNFKGLGTDNASVMVGVNNGVYKLLQSNCQDLILVRCICHSLQLATSAAAQQLPGSIEFVLKETYDWFARSSNRRQAYKDIYNLINHGSDPTKIVHSCTTRWLSIEGAVNSIYNQWLELKTHFSMIKEVDNCYSAEILHSLYNDENYAFLCFLKPTLSQVNRVNKSFEAKSADPTKLFDDVSKLLQELVSKVTTPTSKFQLFKDNIDEYFDSYCYLGYLFEVQMKKMVEAGFGEESRVRKHCHEFLKALIKEIINRTPENIKILTHIKAFSVNNALKHSKNNIVDILVFFKKRWNTNHNY